MIPEMPHKERIVVLYSDTGGGHRSAAEAIMEAFELEFPGRFEQQKIDAFRQYSPPPFNYAPEIYPPLSRMPQVWLLNYRLSDGHRRYRALNRAFWPYLRRSFVRLVNENPAELYISVHPILNGPMIHALKGRGIPFATVVTDMVSTHAFWYDRHADMIIVPTEIARQRGLKAGIDPQRIHTVGQPVAEQFCHPVADKAGLRARLGWPPDLPVILLVGGGEGMGPLEETAAVINEARLPACLVVVAGRNQALRENLEAQSWNLPVRVYGFVREMPDFMAAADVLITKAGPGTISEAFIAGLPIILNNRLPGQEDGNVSYVVNEKAGVWAPKPEQVIAILKSWLKNPEKRQRVAANSSKLARPQATRQIAHLLASLIKERT
jgi:1,2-diacylglycerol 3-beta-galactosyltransferase